MSGPSPSEYPSRREFLKAAVAAGGASALSACLGVAEEPVPNGTDALGRLPERQHAWNGRVRRDDHGNVQLPRHQLLLYLTLDRDGPPTPGDRRTVEAALRSLDRAYERSNEGLIHSVAYSPSYFERFDESLPEDLDLPRPRALSSFETPEFDEQDALVHLASDRASALLEADEALRGKRRKANTVEMAAALTDAFAVDDRRTGFVGEGLPAKRQDVKGIPDGADSPIPFLGDDGPVPKESPLFMGFKAGFKGSQATEGYVTLDSGPFAGGTTKHVATIRQSLQDWYVEQNFDQRVAEMFSPVHVEKGLVEGVGENLGGDNGLTPEMIDSIREHARTFGRVGHAQKAARANRDEEGNVRLLRRHFESTDDDTASLHFPSLQTGISVFEEVREAMNGADLTDEPAIRQRVNNGILEYIFVQSRGNFLVPPRSIRALPTPDGRAPGVRKTR